LKGKEEEEDQKRDDWIQFENDTSAVGVGMWKIETSVYPTSNSLEEGEGEEELLQYIIITV